MTRAQQLVLSWDARLREMGWPDDARREVITEVMEAGYLQAIDDANKKAEADKQRNEALIQKVFNNKDTRN